jgi:hypothetical protein
MNECILVPLQYLPVGCCYMIINDVCVVFLVTNTHFLFIQAKENISVTSVFLLVTVATLMFVVNYYVDGVCIQR